MSVYTQTVAERLTRNHLTLPGQIVKRDGSVVPFDLGRIEVAVRKCFDSLDTPPPASVEAVVAAVANTVASKYDSTQPTVEQVQDVVEFSLLSVGAFDAAKHYILYREEHARNRAQAVPPEIEMYFDVSAEFFQTPIQQFQFFDKYSRFNWDLGRRETWIETVDRVVDYLDWLVETETNKTLPQEVLDALSAAILKQEAMPSMRALSQAGEAAKRDSLAIYNCLGGQERVLTQEGIRTLTEMVGTTQMVINGEGRWVKAEIRGFGIQPLQEITFRPGKGRTSMRHRVQATPDHRWITVNRGEVTDLAVGDVVKFVAAPELDLNLEAWIAGFGFGDGTITSQGEAQVRLCGDKAQYLSRFTDYGHCGVYTPPSQGGDPTVIFHKGHFANWKRLPGESDPDWLASWLEGYLAADGHAGSQPGISSQDAAAIEFVKDVAPLAGYMVTGHNTSAVIETNYGPRKAPLQRLTLRTMGEFWVTHIEDLGVSDEVYCAVVEDGHDFVLANGIHTGNCSYSTVDCIETFVEALRISTAGCGVGFSVERQYVEQFPRIQRQKGGKPKYHLIEDSAFGWSEALRYGLEAWFAGEDVTFEYALIRPSGSPLKIKGGRASGPEPLKYVLDFCRSKILSRQGTFLRTLDAHDIMCVIGGAAVSGGVRRTAMISLYSWDDHDMRDCKNGAFPDYRWNANNSAVWPDGLSQIEVTDQMMAMIREGRGEPGIFSRSNAIATLPERRKPAEFGTNPCGEINLRPQGLCNLTIAVARHDDTEETLRHKVEMATIIGTIQSLATNFPGMRQEWVDNCVQERLLGVDITGQADCPLLDRVTPEGAALRDRLKQHAIDVNAYWAEFFGINPSASITCDKPSGNSSQLLNTASGIHRRWAPFYIRRTRVSGSTPMYRVLKEAGVPLSPENGSSPLNASTWVASWPVKSPEGALTRKDFSAVDQCEFWLLNKMHWTEHNPSVTITYQPEEILALIQWVWDHKDVIGGMAFLPADDAAYQQAPYEEITEARYNELAEAFPKIDFSLLYAFEKTDMTDAAQTVACVVGGDC